MPIDILYEKSHNSPLECLINISYYAIFEKKCNYEVVLRKFIFVKNMGDLEKIYEGIEILPPKNNHYCDF